MIPRRASGFAAALALALLPRPAWAQPVSEGVVRMFLDRATGEIEAIGEAFGWTGPIEWSEGGALDANAERISLNPAEIRELLLRVSPTGQEDAVRMIVAHEVWHYVEFQRGMTAPPGAGERRLGECRADVMAARYLASTEEGPWGYGLYGSKPADIAAELWRTASADHPTPDQRQFASHLGALSGKQDFTDERETIDQLLGRLPDEDAAQWSARICQLILHSQDAAMASVIVSDPAVRTTGGKSAFEVRYTNRSSRKIEVTARIWARRHEDGKTRNWIFPLKVPIEPGATVPVERELGDLLDGEDRPVYLNTRLDDDQALIAARFLPGVSVGGRWAIASGLSPEDTAFALAVQALANGALNNFADFRGTGVTLLAGSSLLFPSTIAIPGSSQTTISLSRDGRATTSAHFATGTPELVDGTQVELRERFRRIWPNARWQDAAGGAVVVGISRYCNARLSIVGRDEFAFVSLTLEPDVFGLVE